MRTHFRKTGWVYLPKSIAGWVIALAYLTLAVLTLVSIDRNYNSMISSLIRFFPYFICLSVIYFWVASNMSEKK